MSFNVKLVLLLACTSVAMVSCQVPGFGGCPEFDSQPDFDMNRVSAGQTRPQPASRQPPGFYRHFSAIYIRNFLSQNNGLRFGVPKSVGFSLIDTSVAFKLYFDCRRLWSCSPHCFVFLSFRVRLSRNRFRKSCGLHAF